MDFVLDRNYISPFVGANLPQPQGTAPSVVEPDTKKDEKRILYIGNYGKLICQKMVEYNYVGFALDSFEKAFKWLGKDPLNKNQLPQIIICDRELGGEDVFQFIKKLKNSPFFAHIHIILLSERNCNIQKSEAVKAGVDDFYAIEDLNTDDLKYRLDFLLQFDRLLSSKTFDDLDINFELPQRKIWKFKRLFDIAVSASILLAISPILILVAILVKLDSRGPVFYISKRAGDGYNVFNFFKFRTMRVGADAELNKLQHLNQYSEGQEGTDGAKFVKLANDPRITRLGHFLRKTSIDELPQLINVLKGDMSLVGNRPLPLYEAEQLTQDQMALRFMAPAGITGLWQVTKRGKKDMSEEERISLDVDYARTNSFWSDVKIMLKTVPALLQKEAV